MPDQQKHRNPLWTRDEVILGLDTYLQRRSLGFRQSDSAIVELSRVLNALAEHLGRNKRTDFRNPNGVYMKMGNFMHLDPDYQGVGLSSVSAMEREVWNEYVHRPGDLHILAASIRNALKETSEELLNTGAEADEHDFPEGALKYRQHVTRERNRELVSRAKERAKQKHGRLYCEACDFDFEAVYGPAGHDYIQCHHTKPVCDLEPGDTTCIDDIALLCANCHCIVHRRRPWLRLEDLRSLLQTNNLKNERMFGKQRRTVREMIS